MELFRQIFGFTHAETAAAVVHARKAIQCSIDGNAKVDHAVDRNIAATKLLNDVLAGNISTTH